jgi:ATP-dependent helicase/nuclease subunit A
VTGEQLALAADEAGGPAKTARVSEEEPTPEQRRAIDERDRDVLLEAGAGTGKTRVLVERYCAAAEHEEHGVDAILAFTFTERAAAELRHRIRDELSRRATDARTAADGERGQRLAELARDSERAWISTIHGFCRRLLAAHPVALGLDPRFRVLDDAEADRIAQRAFDEALETMLAGGDQEPAELVAAMRVPDLRDLVRTAHDELRSQGREPVLPEPIDPDPRSAIEELAAAARGACEETQGGRGGSRNLERLAAASALDPARRQPTEPELAELKLDSSAQAFSGAACDAYRTAWKQARSALAERDAIAHYRHIAELLGLFAHRYAELKDERSGLDFEDLQLEARRLLTDNPGVADTYRARFRHLMVDEFQDTNRLQLELVRLLRGDQTSVFFVGDEFQSIYGFRHANLDVFRRERDRLEALPDSEAEVMRLSGNFRATPELVAAVNSIGAAILRGFAPLTVGALRDDGAGTQPEADLLLTPAGDQWQDEKLGITPLPGDYPSAPDRIAEARFLAARIRKLVNDSDDVRRGDVVVLLRAYTHVAAFEDELERAGLRPYIVGGRGYWSQQQVEDVRRLLGLVANPLDDECLLAVLASPACSVRPDTLWLLRRAADVAGRGRHLWPVVECRFGRGDPPEDANAEGYLANIPEDDATLLSDLCERLAGLRAHAGTVALEDLLVRAVTAFDYDLATLMMKRGTRRYANVRKLMRLAREYEAAEGRDLRGFLDFLAERAGRDREGEAATEAEDHDGVRVMTVHAAKGLEFPVVAVADLGRELLAGGRQPSVKVADADPDDFGSGETGGPQPPRVGIRLARFGTTAIGVFGYNEMLDAAAEDEAAEACRLAYVAATRAQRHLVLSGRYSAKRLAQPVAADDPKPGTPITERLMRSLGIGGDEDTEIDLPAPQPRPGLQAAFPAGRLAVRFNQPDPASFAALRPTVEPGEREAPPTLSPPPLGRRILTAEAAVGHLSYTALATYGRCGYRFFAERILGLPGQEGEPGGDGVAPARRYGFGNAVHAMLEWSARHGWREPEEGLCRDLLRRERLEATRGELDRARSMVAAWLASGLCKELGTSRTRLRPEMPFILPLGGSVVRGTIDLYADEAGLPLVVDYKTDTLGDQSVEELVDRYGVQRSIYALAAAGERQRVRTAYVFLQRAGEPVELELDAAALATARQELEELIAGIEAGRFEVTAKPHAALCWDCPARERLCSHPKELTGRRL